MSAPMMASGLRVGRQARTLPRLLAVLAAIGMIIVMLMPATPAAAAATPGAVPAVAGNGQGNGPGGGCGGRTCDVGDTDDGNGGGQNGGGNDQGGDSQGGGGGSAPTCTYGGEEIPCTVGEWSWYSPRNCYITPVSPQPAEGETPEGWRPPMLGAGEGPGTWYLCGSMYCEPLHLLIGPCAPGFVWIAQGEPTIDPAQAAAAVMARMTVRPVDIGMAPRVNPEWGHRRTHVGVPVWMWVDNPGRGSSEGWSVTDSEGGLSVSATMRIASFQWDMGDGTTVTCGTAGQPYQAGFGWRESPDCGHVYSRTSADQPGDRFTVTETTNWVFDWQAGGQSGSIPLTTTSTTQVEVNELQTVNTSPQG